MPNREDSFIIQAMAATRGRNISMKELRETVEAEHASVAVAGAILAVGGWSGLLWVVLNTLPTVPNRWSFYALLFAALAGTALPFIRLLHRRFSREGGLHIPPGVMVRQALWVGLFGTVCAWLRIPRLLSPPLAVGMAFAFIAIEFLLRLRERTQWRPD